MMLTQEEVEQPGGKLRDGSDEGGAAGSGAAGCRVGVFIEGRPKIKLKWCA